MSVSEDELLAVAHEAAGAAAAELMSRFGGHVRGVRTKSSATDPVSEADLAAEAEIRRVLGERRPTTPSSARRAARAATASCAGSSIRSTGPSTSSSGSRSSPSAWPVRTATGWSSASCWTRCARRPSPGAAGPADLNGETISGSSREDLATALVSTGFAYDAAVRAKQAVVLSRVLPRVRDIRRAGSAALDLAWLACGRYDAYYERGVNLWDYAAGGLIASRAGLAVRELAAADDGPAGLAAAAPALSTSSWA